jgi:hypothetical protein
MPKKTEERNVPQVENDLGDGKLLASAIQEVADSAKKLKTVRFNMDPERGAAGFAVASTPDGYEFVRMNRRGRKVVAFYRKMDAKPKRRSSNRGPVR